MCGICGWIERTSAGIPALATLRGMNATLAHRGPDRAGAALFDGAAIAMSRLSIIDLASGDQPIPNEDSARWAVFNGEIYNFRDLREELLGRGHRFRTRTDSEVILHAYEAWGEDCVQRLNGMFAFCIVETPPGRPARNAFLARDRVGKKPLYYWHKNGRVVFASEIKAILEHPEVSRELNEAAIPLYLTYGYVPAPLTMFRDIHELPPGHTLNVRDGEVEVRRYWDVDFQQPLTGVSEGDIRAELRERFDQAVQSRLESDVPLGAFLSGGVDSTAVVASMARHSSRPVKTFAIGFEGDDTFNELGYARLAARAYETDHHEFVVKPDTIDLLPKLVWHYDQPFADDAAICTYLVAKLTREHVTVCLTGDGGDELFAGYERFQAARLGELYRRTPPLLRRGVLGALSRLPQSTGYYGFARRARRFAEHAASPLEQRYLAWASVFPSAALERLRPGSAGGNLDRHLVGFFDQTAGLDAVSRLLYVHTKSCLPGNLLAKTDRMTMAASLEARSPLLDHSLMEFAARIPASMKLRGLRTKHIFKRAVADMVPREIRNRKKHGFSVPLGGWFRGELKNYVRHVLLDSLASSGYVEPAELRRLVETHQSGQRDYGQQLWALLTLELWRQVFLERRFRAQPDAPELVIHHQPETVTAG